MQICDNIRKYRELRGLSQQKVADDIGEKRTTYAEWENNTEPRASTLLKIAKVLGVKVSDLLEGFDEMPSNDGSKEDKPGYIKTDRYLTMLEEQNEFLRRNFETSLAGILVQSASILAHVGTSLEKDDEREAGGSKEKLQRLKIDTGKRIREKLQVHQYKDKG